MANQRNSDVVEIEIKELFICLLLKWWLILLISIIGALITGSVSKFFITPVFESTSSLYIINRQDDHITTWSDMQTSEFLVKDFRILIKSRPVTEEVIKNLGLDITREELSSKISISTPEGTRILKIMVRYTDAELAKLLVDEITKVSSERLVEVMEIKKVNIIEKGNLPIEPAGPNIRLNTIIGGGLGFFLSSLVIIILHIMNHTIRSAEDVETYLGLTTLGIIPIEISSTYKHKLRKYHKVLEKIKEKVNSLKQVKR